MALDDRREAAVHLGRHKTGTTSLQHALDARRDQLAGRDVHVLTSTLAQERFPLVTSGIGVAELVLRLELDAHHRHLHPDVVLASWRAAAEREVREQAASPQRRLVVSSEGLSFVRSAEEVARLVELLAPRQVKVVMVHRASETFVPSMRSTIHLMGLAESTHPESTRYLGADSWLLDREGLEAPWRHVLGDDAVTVLEYEQLVAAERSTVPGVWRALGLPDDVLAEAGRIWAFPSPPTGPDGLPDDPEVLRTLLLQREALLQATRARLQSVEGSRSWRWTAPLRRRFGRG